LGRGRELPSDHRPDQSAARAARDHPRRARLGMGNEWFSVAGPGVSNTPCSRRSPARSFGSGSPRTSSRSSERRGRRSRHWCCCPWGTSAGGHWSSAGWGCLVLGSGARRVQHTLFTPIARAFLRIGLTPNVVTIIGTAGTTITALVLLPMGHLVVGSLVLGVLVLTDSIDGIMARETKTSSTYGAFLDSTLDRV